MVTSLGFQFWVPGTISRHYFVWCLGFFCCEMIDLAPSAIQSNSPVFLGLTKWMLLGGSGAPLLVGPWFFITGGAGSASWSGAEFLVLLSGQSFIKWSPDPYFRHNPFLFWQLRLKCPNFRQKLHTATEGKVGWSFGLRGIVRSARAPSQWWGWKCWGCYPCWKYWWYWIGPLECNCSLNDLRTYIPNTVLWPPDICIECGRALDSTCILPAEGDTGTNVCL